MTHGCSGRAFTENPDALLLLPFRLFAVPLYVVSLYSDALVCVLLKVLPGSFFVCAAWTGADNSAAEAQEIWRTIHGV